MTMTPVERRLDACGLLDRRSALETSQADVHKSVEDAIISGFIQSSTDTTPWITQRKTRARTRARTSPPPPLPVLEISPLFASWNATTPWSSARQWSVMSVLPQFVGAAVLHVGVNDIKLRFYRSLIETVCNTSPEATIIVSGPLPMYRQGQESDACGETTLPVSCWIGGQRLKHHKPMFTSQWLEDAIISGFIQSGTDTTPWITKRKTRARTRARTSPPPGTASPLFVSKDKVRTHCFPGAHVLDVAAQVPEILNSDERVGAVVLNVGVNDIRLRF
ncbi:hypothetical protein F2P79_021593 [Pimephales promelas]|nr:hypothetical protein F2P79_021593 [Pimephales promelas]